MEADLKCICIDDESHKIWTAGETGSAYYSLDGRIRWGKILFEKPVHEQINDICLTNNGRSIWLAGNNNTFLVSYKSGANWSSPEVDFKFDNLVLNKIKFNQTGKEGWLSTDNALIYHSTSSGRKWNNLIDEQIMYRLREVSLNSIFIEPKSNTTYIGTDNGQLLI